MSYNQMHRDLQNHLKQKIKRAISDHADMCETVDLPGEAVAAGLADVLLQVTASYFIVLNVMPQQFGQLCHDAYKELQEREREREA